MDEIDAARLDTLAKAFPDSYILERQVGRGGMAHVYRAIDRKHGRPVAIKVMRPDLTTPDGVARFLREIRLTARLSHPHILPLLDSGSVAGSPFFVMPFVEGESLRDCLRRPGRLSLDNVLRIGGEVADALAYAHAQGIVHCDIKPDNILLSGRHALVADFGVARAMRAVAEDETTTTLRMAIGTPSYMSPEQALDEDVLDGRSDVYSLGVVMFELLTGERPYEGGSVAEVIAKAMAGPTPSARARNPEVPEGLDRVLRTAMARERHERFATAADFAAVVDDLERGAALKAPQPSPPALVTPSIAVLPFRDLSPEPDNRHLSEGIAEEVTVALGRVRAFRVCAYASARAVGGASLQTREIGERLGVAHLLTGSVRRVGERLRVNVELVNASDGVQLWAEKFDRRFSDSMAVQDEIADAIAASLAWRSAAGGPQPMFEATTRIAFSFGIPTVDTPRSGTIRTRNPQAYERYLRGRFLWNRRTPDRIAEAIRCFDEAATLDPGFALAHAGLAAARATTALYGTAAPAAAMSEARRAAERALALDASCTEARTALALVLAGYDWNWDAAQHQLHEASLSAPNDATPQQWLASVCLLPQGRIDEALEAVRRALRRDPLSLTVKTTLAAVLYGARRYREAIVAARDVTALDPSFAPAFFFLGQSLMLVEEHPEAIEVCRRAAELSSRSVESLAVLCVALSRANDRAAACLVRDELIARAATEYVSKGQLALASVGFGELDEALHHLETAVEERATDLIWLASRPVWDPVRGHERFQRVLDRLGLAEGGQTPFQN